MWIRNHPIKAHTSTKKRIHRFTAIDTLRRKINFRSNSYLQVSLRDFVVRVRVAVPRNAHLQQHFFRL
jgi:hypothetical protein